MLAKLKDFFFNSYHSDRIAFMLEMFSFVVTVGASLGLAYNAQHPDMVMLYPWYFLGSVTGCIAHYRRQLVWPWLITGFFTISNVFGFFRALGMI
jgi:hypothetical protein